MTIPGAAARAAAAAARAAASPAMEGGGDSPVPTACCGLLPVYSGQQGLADIGHDVIDGG
jgi:hypothetical protein